ncbi:MAG: hypothetical protein N3D11_12995 [Candidatus Sumerlaeia bacterium]|nr:hypothetical protein [Candidatus Sumerlaeia bacterium]
MKRKVWMIVIALVVVVLVAVAGVFLFSGRLLKTGIEVGGTQALGVKTSVQKVHLSLLGGELGLDRLAIGNPEGFESDHLFALGHGGVKVDLVSLLSSQAVIHEIELVAPDILIEQKGLQTNLFTVLKSGKSKEPAAKAQEPAKQEKKPAGEKGKTFRIEKLRIADPKISVRLLGKVQPAVTLPTIELTNISNADGSPMVIDDIFRQVLAAIAASCVKNGQGLLPDELLGTMAGEVAALKDLGLKVLDVGGELAEKAGKAVGQAAKSAVEEAGKVGEAAKDAAKSITDEAGKVGEAAKSTVEKGKDALKGLLPGRK